MAGKKFHRPLALFLILIACATVTAKAPRELTIVAFGDSTTAVRHNVELVYADRLPALLMERGVKARVINSGISGSHTGWLINDAHSKVLHARDRFYFDVRRRQPDVVIIQFGWNDSWVDRGGAGDRSRIALEAYEANLRHLVKVLQKDQARVIMMTPNQPRSDFEPWRRRRTLLYVNALRQVAKDAGVELVDVWEAYSRYHAVEGQSVDDLLLDQIHPNDQGHALVARLLAQTIVSPP